MDAIQKQDTNVNTTQKSNRNSAVSLIKWFASMMVVVAHVPFPGRFGKVMRCLARFTVPFFFMISGYYAYRIPYVKIVDRLKKMIFIILWTNLLFLCCRCFSAVIFDHKDLGQYLARLFTVKKLARFVFLGRNPFSGYQLWYLNAVALTYIALGVYTRFWKEPDQINYSCLYIISFCGLMFQIALGTKAEAVGLKISHVIYRYCLFYGLPLFSLGLFMHEYGERVATNYSLDRIKSMLLIAFGIALSLLQWFGLGNQEMPLGMLLVVIGIAMLTLIHPGPQLLSATMCFLLEKCSLMVYIIHPLVNLAINKLQDRVPLFSKMISMKSIYPLCIIAICLAIGFLYGLISLSVKKIRDH